MRKVLFIIHRMYGGGAQKAAASIINGLDSNLYDKTVYIFDNAHSQYTLDARVIDGQTPNTANAFMKAVLFFRRYSAIAKLKKNADVAVSFLGSPNLLNVLTRRQGCKTVLSVRNYLSGSTNKEARLYRWAAKHLYNKADVVVGVSRRVSEDLMTNYGLYMDQVVTINNFVKAPKNEGAAAPIDRPYILCAGRLHRHKGFDFAIRAFAKMHRQGRVLVIMGDGALMPELKALAQRLGVGDAVIFPGYVKNPYPYYTHAEGFLLSSIIEGFPNVVVEAMASGLPILATDCISGPREIMAYEGGTVTRLVETAYGLLTPVVAYDAEDEAQEAQIKEMTRGLERLITPEVNHRYRKKALERAAYYSEARIMGLWKKLLG